MRISPISGNDVDGEITTTIKSTEHETRYDE